MIGFGRRQDAGEPMGREAQLLTSMFRIDLVLLL
jgi:hypothetical protein